MENKLEIRNDSPGKEQRLFLDGRLDANWAGHLDDYLNGMVRDGHYHIILNMAGVQYLSSAGIRILVNQYKKIKKIGGLFVLEELSGNVAEVLEMVGMTGMFTERAAESGPEQKTTTQNIEYNGYRFDNFVLGSEPMTLKLTGNPDLTRTSAYTSDDNLKIKFNSDQFAIGIGAIGDGFDDCKNRYGEFMALGDVLVYKPSDGSKLPDYAIKTGKLEPEINALYSVQAEGKFSNLITFDPNGTSTSIKIEELVTGIQKITNFNQFVFLMIAECSGLVGMSLNQPPVDGNRLFDFPEIRENIHFTTEPAYTRMLTVSLGFFGSNPDGKLKPFLRPVKPGSSACIHTHTVVFPYQALPKQETSSERLIRLLFESSIAQDVLHLINDSREIAGIGDSTFKQGNIWIGKIS